MKVKMLRTDFLDDNFDSTYETDWRPLYENGEKDKIKNLVEQFLYDTEYEFDPKDIQVYEEGHEFNLKNTKVVYEMFKHLPKSLLIKRTFWMGLLHSQYIDFMFDEIKVGRNKNKNVCAN
jgi:hypothetical protein